MNIKEIGIRIEGGENMRDISELHQSEIGEIVWQHRSGASNLYIAKRLRVKLWQIENYVNRLRECMTKDNQPLDSDGKKPPQVS